MIIFGTLNAGARFVTIYTPYGGARYVARNTVQNQILLAMTQPTAFRQVVKSSVTLRRQHPELYDAVKVEAGSVQAAAGLPELPGRRQPAAYCRGCGRDFSNTRHFDRHRIGVHAYDWSLDRPDGRRCMNEDELLEAGLRPLTDDEMASTRRHRHRVGSGVAMWSDPAELASVREAVVLPTQVLTEATEAVEEAA